MFRRIILLLVILMPAALLGAGHVDFNGAWELVPPQSSVISLYGSLFVDFIIDGDQVTVVQQWGTRPRDSFKDTVSLKTDGKAYPMALQHQVAPSNIFLGVANNPGSQRSMSATWNADGTVLTLKEKLPIRASQGKSEIQATHTYALNVPEQLVTYTVTRASRNQDAPMQYLLKRRGSRQAYFMHMTDDWDINSKLPEQAMLISLQGVANTDGPHLYFIYGEKWDFKYTPGVFDFLKNERQFTFRELRTAEQALATFRDKVKGYVVWDKDVRTSLIVAYTVAGLEQAVVVSEELIPMMQKAGLEPVADFRGQFTGQTDVQIYRWAKEQYWDRCSREYIVWLGGDHGTTMRPGVADWGMHKKMFFNDLSARPEDEEEYRLADELLSDMQPYGFVFGWHSYKKDLEEEWVRFTSRHALRVEGLHTLPNMSFISQVPATPGFVFKNNHQLVPGKKYKVEKKVYIACIQTDGIGLGAWTQPGRGELPYAWEVGMNYVWLAPAMLEYFYSQSTPADYFVGGLGGPGYVYPKAVPPQHLPKMVDLAYDLMQRLDLNLFEIMDYSEGVMVEGNSDLTPQVVDAFYQGMPDIVGLVNGYVQSHTFTVHDKKPLISYDYYLAPDVNQKSATADLQELTKINSHRPYFLLIHVRQWSNIKRVKAILDNLGPDVEVLPLDVFMKMAGENPTFQEQFRQD